MSNLKNKVQLIGNLGDAPETKKLDGGRSVTKFSLATNEVWTDNKGERHEETQWHRVVAWGKQGETMAQYLNKGSQVAIEGKLKYDKYDDKDGVTRYTTDIVVSEFVFLDKKVA